MLTIRRKFKIGFYPKSFKELSKKLDDLNVIVLYRKSQKITLNGKEIEKIYLDCVCSQTVFDELICYLESDIKYSVTIEY